VSTLGRIRKRREADRNGLERTVRLLITNAALVVAKELDPPTFAMPLAKPTGARSRYDAPPLGQLDAALSALSPSFITLRKSRRKGTASTIKAGAGLADALAQLGDGFGPDSFRTEGGETIVLNRVHRDHARDTREAERLEYEDDGLTEGFRSTLDQINAALDEVSLTCAADGGPPVELGSRRLRRIFQLAPNDLPRWSIGGRLHGGFWINMRRERRASLRLNGERMASCDFQSMGLRLAYTRAGLEPPRGDLYAGILSQGDAGGRWREGVKRVVGAMLFRSTPLRRLPKGSAGLLPEGCTGRAIRAAILERHAPIAGQLEAGIGPTLTRNESDILIEVLLRLIELGVPALPLHDAVLVESCQAKMVAEVMGEVSEQQTGWELPVGVV
jgi:hypothetical protein